MCDKRFVQIKTIPIEFTFKLWKKLTSNSTSLKIFCKIPTKNFDGGGGGGLTEKGLALNRDES